MELKVNVFGTPGEPVPQVDPVDIQLVWKEQQEHEKRFPRSKFGLGAVAGGKSPCSEGADVAAVGYRTTILNAMIFYRPEVATHVKDGELDESLCRAIAEIPMEWIGRGGHEGFPFDEEEFMLRLRGEQI